MLKTSLAALLLASSAVARPAPTTWTTFMRAGPSERSAVIDEVDGGTVVDVQSCDAGWCRVEANRAIGYLPQALLALEPPAAAAPPGEQSCFASQAFTRHGTGPVFYCPRR